MRGCKKLVLKRDFLTVLGLEGCGNDPRQSRGQVFPLRHPHPHPAWRGKGRGLAGYCRGAPVRITSQQRLGDAIEAAIPMLILDTVPTFTLPLKEILGCER